RDKLVTGVQTCALPISGNFIEGNFIGTDVTGTLAVSNIFDGVGIRVGNNLIGGTTLDARNVLSGNGLRGVDMIGSNVTANLIKRSEERRVGKECRCWRA